MKLPRNYGIFFLKEEKEEVWEDNHAGSLIFLFPTDFTDTHRLLTYGVQADLQSAFKKNVPTYLEFADLQSAAGKNAVAGLGLTPPRLSLEKDGIFTFSSFKALGGVPDMVFLKMGGKNGKNRIYHLNNKIYPSHCSNATP